MKRAFYLLAFQILSILSAIGQTNVDSLINLLSDNTKEVKEKLEIYENICQCFYSSFDAERSLEFGQKGLKLAQKENDILKISIFNEYLGLAYNDKQMYDTAYTYYDKALSSALESKDEEQILSIYLTIGAYYGQRSNLTIALESFLKALPIAENLDNKEKVTLILGNIGGIYTMLDNHDKALFYFEKMKVLSEDIDYYPGIRKSYYELGKIYIIKAKYNEALELSQKVLDMSRIHNDKLYEILSLQNLAQVYSKKENADYDSALEYAEKSQNISKEINNMMLLASALNIKAGVYLLQNRFKECEQAALESYQTDSTNIQTNMDILYKIVMCNISMGNRKKAIDYFDKYCTLKDRYIDKNIHEALLEMETKYETEKKELHITTLEKEKQSYLWLGFAGIVALLMFVGILFYRHRLNLQKRKLAEQQVVQLEKEKQLIATQSVLEGETAERSRLARDLHDGLGGMLSVVKLNLKDIYNTSPANEVYVNRFERAIEMLDESIKELRRIAHHMMPESLIHFGLKVSLEDFCRAVPIAHFQYLGEESRIDSRLEEMIYRCAYELVNNAIKHAGASTINIQLLIDNNLIALTVYDDGKGFDTESNTTGTGLKNIRTRVLAYNGRMDIRSTHGKGTEVIIEIESL